MAGDIKYKHTIQMLHVQFGGTVGCSGSDQFAILQLFISMLHGLHGLHLALCH